MAVVSSQAASDDEQDEATHILELSDDDDSADLVSDRAVSKSTIDKVLRMLYEGKEPSPVSRDIFAFGSEHNHIPAWNLRRPRRNFLAPKRLMRHTLLELRSFLLQPLLPLRNHDFR